MIRSIPLLFALCAVTPVCAAQKESIYKLHGKGSLVAIDCRRNGNASDYAEGAAKIVRTFGIVVSNVQGKAAFSLGNATDQLKASGGNVAVFLIDDPSFPMALSASEERWAMLNVAKLKSDNPNSAKLAHRTAVLFTRQACRVLGGDEAKGCDTCFHSVLGVKDIDDVTSLDITMGPELSVKDVLELRGIEVEEYGTYEDACEMGIAAPPTNDYQKAIWDKVHAPPKTPLKIKFDPASQKGKVTK